MFPKIEMMLAYMLVKKRENVNEDEKWWKSLTGQKLLNPFSQTVCPWTVRTAPIDQNILRLKQNHQLERDFSDALWEWREVKSSTEAYDCSLDKEFRADDSRIATCQISRKLGPDSI